MLTNGIHKIGRLANKEVILDDITVSRNHAFISDFTVKKFSPSLLPGGGRRGYKMVHSGRDVIIRIVRSLRVAHSYRALTENPIIIGMVR